MWATTLLALVASTVNAGRPVSKQQHEAGIKTYDKTIRKDRARLSELSQNDTAHFFFRNKDFSGPEHVLNTMPSAARELKLVDIHGRILEGEGPKSAMEQLAAHGFIREVWLGSRSKWKEGPSAKELWSSNRNLIEIPMDRENDFLSMKKQRILRPVRDVGVSERKYEIGRAVFGNAIDGRFHLAEIEQLNIGLIEDIAEGFEKQDIQTFKQTMAVKQKLWPDVSSDEPFEVVQWRRR